MSIVDVSPFCVAVDTSVAEATLSVVVVTSPSGISK
jgi:hypothetical protein